MTSAPSPQPSPPNRERNSSKRRIWFIAAVVAAAFTILVVAVVALRTGATDLSTGAAEEPRATDENGALEYPDVVWPQNMVSGGILFEERGGALLPRASEALDDNELPRPYDVDRGTGSSDIVLYVDYRCPVCSQFEMVNGDTLEEAVASGSATLEVRTLTFLDRVDETDYYSSRVSSAMACLADSRPELTWDAHRALLDPEFMPTESARGYTNEEIADEIDGIADGLDDETRSCITNETFVPFAAAINQWSFATPVPNAVDDELSIEGTPLAVVSGEPYEGSPADAEEFKAFLEQQGVAVG
ncbi:thioredoxin domain-containing protein [Leucobacter sp. GX24907]